MGGRAPLGYDAKDRKLVTNEEEAKLVNDMYVQYLELGSVAKLKTYLDQRGIKSKRRITPAGNQSGGMPFHRGALYLILQNRIYLGEVFHRDQIYSGEHEAIVGRDLWERVQARLRSDNGGKRNDVRANCSNLLLGLLQDVEGKRFRPSHTVKKGKRYRYYFLPPPFQESNGQSKPLRLPAYDVEVQVSARLQSFLQSTSEVMMGLSVPQEPPEATRCLLAAASTQAKEFSMSTPATAQEFLRKIVRRVIVGSDKIEVEVSRTELRALLTDTQSRTPALPLQKQLADPEDLISLSVEARLRRFGGEMRLVVSPDYAGTKHVTPLLKAVARAYRWREGILSGDSPKRTLTAKHLGLHEEYLRRVLGCAFLAPDIVEAILDGHYPTNLSVKKMSRRHLPLDWAEQRLQMGFPPR